MYSNTCSSKDTPPLLIASLPAPLAPMRLSNACVAHGAISRHGERDIRAARTSQGTHTCHTCHKKGSCVPQLQHDRLVVPGAQDAVDERVQVALGYVSVLHWVLGSEIRLDVAPRSKRGENCSRAQLWLHGSKVLCSARTHISERVPA